MNENIKLTGTFRLQCIDANGKVLHSYEEHNLVVDLGRSNIVRLLGGSGSGLSITKISVGTNGTPPASSDSSITGAFTKSLNTGTGQANSYTTNTVTYQYQIDTTEANGTPIREFGLLNSGSVLCARKALDTPIVKNSSFAIVGSWTLQVN